MAEIKYIQRTVALDGGPITEQLPASFFNDEQSAHMFIISGVRGGAPLSFTGTVSASMLNANDETVPIWGCNIVNGAAVVVLSDACYQVNGRITITISVNGAAVYCAESRIKRRSSSTAYDPSGVITDISALASVVAELHTAAAAAAVPAMDIVSPRYWADSNYEVGSYVVQDGKLYRCTTDIPLPGETWNTAHWTRVYSMGEVQKLNEDMAAAQGTLTDLSGRNYVLFSAQTKPNADKRQARLNIGAVDPAAIVQSWMYYSDHLYKTGDLVINDGQLYRCTNDFSTAHAWDSDDWEQITVEALVDDTPPKSVIAYDYSADSDYAVGSLVIYNRELYRCNTAIPAGGEAWNAEHWDNVNVAWLLEALPAQLAPVRYTWNQGLTDDQKAAARNNIEAVEPIAIAPVYDATKAYTAGEYFTYYGLLYKCIQNAPAGTSPNNYNYFDNPAISSEVAYALAVCVRNTWNQGLTADQQAAARFNISAVGYTWNQGLTDDQQAAARNNIGAVGADVLSPSKYDAVVPYIASRQGFETVSGLPMLILYETENGGAWDDMTKDNAIAMNWRMLSVRWVQHPLDSTKHAIASVDTGDVAANTCTVKWQGSSSLSYPKKNFTIKLSSNFNFSLISGNPGMDYEDTVSGDPDWGSHKKYVLKANYVDPSHARNVCLCKIWGDVVRSRGNPDSRLTALPNCGAIDGFPIMLVLAPADGSEWQYLGLYTLNIPKDDWMFGMDVKENGVLKYPNAAILCAERRGNVSGFWQEAILNPNDETELWDSSVSGVPFEIEYNDSATAADIRDSLNDVIAQGLAVFNADSATRQTELNTLWALIDKDSVIDHYIFVCMFGANDCMGRNYLLVNYDVGGTNNKWFMSEYDLDSVLGILWTGTDYRPADTAAPTFYDYAWGQGNHALMRIIYTYEKPALIARYRALRSGILSENHVATVLRNFTRRIPKGIKDIEARLWPTTPSMDTSTTEQMISWYEARCKAMDEELYGTAVATVTETINYLGIAT